MKNLSEEQSVSPSDIRRALPVGEKISEEKISDVLDALLYCRRTECLFCPYEDLSGTDCVSKMMKDAGEVIRFLKSNQRKAYVAPKVVIMGADDGNV